MKKYLNYSLLLSCFFLLTNCSEFVIGDETVDPGPVLQTVKYNPDVANIINTNCVSCHGAVNPRAGLSLTTYSQVRNATENGDLVNRMNNLTNPMPEGGLLPAATRAVIDKWVTDGYLEN